MKKYLFKTDIKAIEKYKLTVLIMLISGKMKKLIWILLIPYVILMVLLNLNSTDSESPFSSLIFPAIIFFIFFVLPLLALFVKNSPEYEFDDWGMSLNNKRNERVYRFSICP